jgi:DNA-binding NtrC family response regulator
MSDQGNQPVERVRATERLREASIPLSAFCRSAYEVGLNLLDSSLQPGRCFCSEISGDHEAGEDCLKFRRGLFSRTSITQVVCPAGVSMVAMPLLDSGKTYSVLLTDGFLEASSSVRPGKDGNGDSSAIALPEGAGSLPRLSPEEIALLLVFTEKAGTVLSIVGSAHRELVPEDAGVAEWRRGESSYSFVGSSPKIARIRETLPTFANSSEPVLIESEPGNGRHLVASLLHRLGPRTGEPLIFENLSLLPESLHEKEIFGRQSDGSQGLAGLAAGGTLFLDGLEHLSPPAQRKLFAFLKDGGTDSGGNGQAARARIVATTDRSLGELVRKGRFRSDLQRKFSRLTLFLPPLRERKDDIPLLVQHFLPRLADNGTAHPPALEKDTLQALREYSWPGNVRELREELERAGALGEPAITLDDFSPPVQHAARPPRATVKNIREAVGSLETEMISRTLSDTNWNKSQAARILGLSRLGLQKKIDRYGLDRRR